MTSYEDQIPDKYNRTLGIRPGATVLERRQQKPLATETKLANNFK